MPPQHPLTSGKMPGHRPKQKEGSKGISQVNQVSKRPAIAGGKHVREVEHRIGGGGTSKDLAEGALHEKGVNANQLEKEIPSD